jgi:cold shock CspA family protein
MRDRELNKISTYNGTYAFIQPDTGERDVFAHEGELPNDIRRGDGVSFVVAPDPYKPGKVLARGVRLEDEKSAP